MIWFVDSDRSNMGIGKLLLESLDKELVDRNIETTVVDVRKTSLGAIRGYQRNGFEIRNKTLLSLVLFKENF
jgi:ribosomal protein S18 acetylase RimI-like enzyme